MGTRGTLAVVGRIRRIVGEVAYDLYGIASSLTCHANNYLAMLASFLMAIVDGPPFKAHPRLMDTVPAE